MKIQLPNGKKVTLDDNIELSEKLVLVQHLTDEWMLIIIENWDSNSTKYFLDSLTNYIVWHKEPEDSKEDKEVMSRNKTNRLHRGRKDIPFSSLSTDVKDLLFSESRGYEND